MTWRVCSARSFAVLGSAVRRGQSRIPFAAPVALSTNYRTRTVLSESVAQTLFSQGSAAPLVRRALQDTEASIESSHCVAAAASTSFGLAFGNGDGGVTFVEDQDNDEYTERTGEEATLTSSVEAFLQEELLSVVRARATVAAPPGGSPPPPVAAAVGGTTASSSSAAAAGPVPSAAALGSWSGEKVNDLFQQLSDRLQSRSSARAASFTARTAGGVATSLTPEQLADLRGALDFLITHLPATTQFCLEACLLAFHAGLHSRCCELFCAFIDGSAPSLFTSSGVETLVEVVLRAAVAAEDRATLQRCLHLALRLVERERVSTTAGFSSKNENPTEQWVASPAVMLVLRVYVQCAVLCASQPGRTVSSLSDEKGESEIPHGNPPVDATTASPSPSSSVEALGQHMAMEAAPALRIPKDTVEVFFAESVRLIQYNRRRRRGGEVKGSRAGEAAVAFQLFQLWCREFSSSPPPPPSSSSTASPGAQHSPLGSSEVRWLNASCLHVLLRAAVAEQSADMAELAALYVDLYLDGLFRGNQGTANALAEEEQEGREEGMMTAENDHRPQASGKRSERRESDEASMPILSRSDDALIVTLLRFFSSSRQTTRALRWFQQLQERFPAFLPSVPLANVIARLAAECRDVKLAAWSLETILSERQPSPPSSADLFATLCACARSGMPNLNAVLYSLLEHDLLRLNEEELLFIRLQHCRRELNWRAELEETLRLLTPQGESGEDSAPFTVPSSSLTSTTSPVCGPTMSARHGDHTLTTDLPAAVSIRNVEAILLIMQEGEYAHFMTYYRYFLSRCTRSLTTEDRVMWALSAVVWATTNAGRLPPQDVLYIAQEVQQLLRSTVTSPSAARTRRSLQVKWENFRLQYPPKWWARQQRRAAHRRESRQRRGVGETGNTATVEQSAADLSLPSIGTQMAAPLFARFAKRKHLVRLSQSPLHLLERTTAQQQRDIYHRVGDTGETEADVPGRVEWQRYLRESANYPQR